MGVVYVCGWKTGVARLAKVPEGEGGGEERVELLEQLVRELVPVRVTRGGWA